MFEFMKSIVVLCGILVTILASLWFQMLVLCLVGGTLVQSWRLLLMPLPPSWSSGSELHKHTLSK